MYSLVMVDDEIWTLRDMQGLLENTDGFEIAGLYTNPLEAEKAILEGRKQIADGLLAERNRELKEQARRIDRLRRELEELKKQKDETEEESRTLKRFLDQPDEKPRFEKFLADKQEEELRAEMERQTCLTTRKPTPAHEDNGPSCSPR